MINFILIGLCIAIGALFRQSGTLPKDAHKGINAWIIYVALPAVSFKYLPYIQWSAELILPVISPVIIWAGAWAWTELYSRKQNLDKASIGGLKLTTGLSNTSFVGFPLIMAYFSEKELGIAIICDQMTFFLFSTVGLMTAVNSSDNHTFSWRIIVRKLLRFPPFLGCIAALILPLCIDISQAAPLFDKLAATVAPLALFSIGLQLKLKGWQSQIKHISAALFYKLFVAPLLVLGVVLAFGLHGRIAQISVFEAAMPTLLSSSIMAADYELNPDLVNLIIGISILASLLTTGGWWLALQMIR